MFDHDLRIKLCEFMSIDSLLTCRKLTQGWKKSVELFMLNTLLSRLSIKSLFLNNFKSCSLCDTRCWKKDLRIGYGPSFTWGIREYLCCKKCIVENSYLFKE